MKVFRRVAVVVVVGLLLYVNIHQAFTIAHQRELILSMWQYIQTGCPELH
jgi:hypothetical protein